MSAREVDDTLTKHDKLIVAGCQQGAGAESRILRQSAALPQLVPELELVQDCSMLSMAAVIPACAELHLTLATNDIQVILMDHACTVGSE